MCVHSEVHAIPDLGCVRAAVLKCAPHEWYSIGRQLGFTSGQITSMTHALGPGTGKLEKLVDVKAAAVGAEETAGMLLEACARLTNPVMGEVRMILEEPHHP